MYIRKDLQYSVRLETINCPNCVSLFAVVGKLPEVELRTQGSRPRPRTQKISRPRPRTDPFEAKAKNQEHRRKCSPKKKSSKIFFRRKRSSKIFFQAIST